MSPDPSAPWASRFDVLLLDLDGVVYAGAGAIPYAVTALNRVSDQGVHLAYVTNNASRPPSAVVAHLADLGLVAAEADVVTSAQAGARLISESLPAGAEVLVVGGEGLREAVHARGFQIVEDGLAHPAAVIMGFSPEIGWRQLAQATYAVTGGAEFFATNTDRTIPTADGIAPGNGMLVAVVSQVTGVLPRIAGKPERPLMLESVERTSARRPLVVGDRLDTDIAGARGAGLASLLVLTGVSTVSDLLTAPPAQRPDYLAVDLRALLDGPAVLTAGLAVESEHVVRDPSRHWLETVASTALECWEAADAGRDIDTETRARELMASRPE
ncbi:MAG: HAD-IIA family hydrolase [Actinobacteria bacterium]|nr:HAD-IIA family hydrolase [Actinomycetota bacterium]